MDYQKQGTDFLAKHGLEFRAVHIGHDCPPFCEDSDNLDELETFPRKSHIHGHHYHITISAKGRGHFTLDFWNSYADEEHNFVVQPYFHARYKEHYDMRARAIKRGRRRIEPSPYDVLTCIQKNDPGSFEDFCGDCGYDTDSRKAESIYFAVQKEWSKARKFFTSEQLEELQEIQ